MRKSQIIRRDRDFELIFATGKKFHLSALTLIYLKRNDDNALNRFAFLVSKKISKKAHERNLLKRRLRAICRALPLKDKGLDIVLIPKPNILVNDFKGLKELTEAIFRKAKLL